MLSASLRPSTHPVPHTPSGWRVALEIEAASDIGRFLTAPRVPGDSSGSQHAHLTRIEMMHLSLAGYRG